MIHTVDVEGLKVKINQLHTEHRDLDDVINRLSQSAAQDQLQLQRLKKRKLFLKDQIAMLERQLEPDIRA
ncbi:MAG TPA: YdcH family protein [Burkholderiales bacterium]|nr:YdcH family protein [Burkholderiales bacterium]